MLKVLPARHAIKPIEWKDMRGSTVPGADKKVMEDVRKQVRAMGNVNIHPLGREYDVQIFAKYDGEKLKREHFFIEPMSNELWKPTMMFLDITNTSLVNWRHRICVVAMPKMREEGGYLKLDGITIDIVGTYQTPKWARVIQEMFTDHMHVDVIVNDCSTICNKRIDLQASERDGYGYCVSWSYVIALYLGEKTTEAFWKTPDIESRKAFYCQMYDDLEKRNIRKEWADLLNSCLLKGGTKRRGQGKYRARSLRASARRRKTRRSR